MAKGISTFAHLIAELRAQADRVYTYADPRLLDKAMLVNHDGKPNAGPLKMVGNLLMEACNQGVLDEAPFTRFWDSRHMHRSRHLPINLAYDMVEWLGQLGHDVLGAKRDGSNPVSRLADALESHVKGYTTQKRKAAQ